MFNCMACRLQAKTCPFKQNLLNLFYICDGDIQTSFFRTQLVSSLHRYLQIVKMPFKAVAHVKRTPPDSKQKPTLGL